MDRVLVIEDDDRIARLVSRALSDDGYGVERAARGHNGLAEAELLARVHARLRAPAPGAASRWLRAGPIRLDLRLRRAEVRGSYMDLSFREFLLLQHVMRRAGQPCSRGELLSDVWGLTFDPGSNVVDVCVRRLRMKLDRPDRIETVRNVGYRFTVE